MEKEGQAAVLSLLSDIRSQLGQIDGHLQQVLSWQRRQTEALQSIQVRVAEIAK